MSRLTVVAVAAVVLTACADGTVAPKNANEEGPDSLVRAPVEAVKPVDTDAMNALAVARTHFGAATGKELLGALDSGRTEQNITVVRAVDGRDPEYLVLEKRDGEWRLARRYSAPPAVPVEGRTASVVYTSEIAYIYREQPNCCSAFSLFHRDAQGFITLAPGIYQQSETGTNQGFRSGIFHGQTLSETDITSTLYHRFEFLKWVLSAVPGVAPGGNCPYTNYENHTQRGWPVAGGDFNLVGYGTLNGQTCFGPATSFSVVYRVDQREFCSPLAYVTGPASVSTPGTKSWSVTYSSTNPRFLQSCDPPGIVWIGWHKNGWPVDACYMQTTCSLPMNANDLDVHMSAWVTFVAGPTGWTKTAAMGMDTDNQITCPVSLSMTGNTAPTSAGTYTYSANASTSPCNSGQGFSFSWQATSYSGSSWTPCGDSSVCPINFDPANPIHLSVTATMPWANTGTTTSASATLDVIAPISVSNVNGPTSTMTNQSYVWWGSVSGGVAPLNVGWYLDNNYVGSGTSWVGSPSAGTHALRMIASDSYGHLQYGPLITIYSEDPPPPEPPPPPPPPPPPDGCEPPDCYETLRAAGKPARPQAKPSPTAKQPTASPAKSPATKAAPRKPGS